jgi:imidazolonepropionase-like amidohydrolase
MRRLFISSTFLLLICLLISCATQPDTQIKVLQGATLFNGTGAEAVENSVIVIKGDKIDCIGSADDCTIPTGAETIDVSGKYITPGLVDAHVHFFQTGFFDSRPDALDLRDTYSFPKVAAYQKQHPQRYYNSYLCSGITGVYDVGGFTWSLDFQEEAEQNPKTPHVAAAGPLITPSAMDIFNTPADKVLVNLDSKEKGVRMVEYLSTLESTGIKLWQLRPDDEQFMSYVDTVAETAKKHDKSLIAHATTLNQAKSAVRHGTKLLVHSVSDKEVDQQFIDMAKQEGTIYTPTLIVGSGYMLAYRAAAGVAEYPFDDPNGCIDSKTTELLKNASQFSNHPAFSESFVQRLKSFDPQEDRVSKTAMANLKKVYEAGLPIAVGTDAGNPGTLHGPSIYEEMEAMQQAGIPAEDLITMATRNGARAMQRADDFGTLEQGKFANLIVLEENPAEDIDNMRSITQTMIKGKLMKVENFNIVE